MMKQKISALVIAGAVAGLTQAQDAEHADREKEMSASQVQTMPVPQAAPGKCQALVIVPAKFTPRTKEVVIKEATQTKTIIPAQYEWIEQQIMIRPAGEELKVIPATYKSVEKEVLIEPQAVEKKVIPPKYGQVIDEIVAKPTYMAAQSLGPARMFRSVGEALRLVEVPAEKANIKKQVVQESVRVTEKPIQAKYVTVKTEVIDQPARIEKVAFPAQYKTVRVKKLIKEAQEVEKEIPAEYAQVKVFDKVSDAKMRWQEVLCSNDFNKSTIKAVQSALNKAGYKAGTPDGVLGAMTLRALEQYQKKHMLATGGITIETLESLGISQ